MTQKKTRPVPEALWRPQDLPAALGVSRSTAWRVMVRSRSKKAAAFTRGCFFAIVRVLHERPAPDRPGTSYRVK